MMATVDYRVLEGHDRNCALEGHLVSGPLGLEVGLIT